MFYFIFFLSFFLSIFIIGVKGFLHVDLYPITVLTTSNCSKCFPPGSLEPLGCEIISSSSSDNFASFSFCISFVSFLCLIALSKT